MNIPLFNADRFGMWFSSLISRVLFTINSSNGIAMVNTSTIADRLDIETCNERDGFFRFQSLVTCIFFVLKVSLAHWSTVELGPLDMEGHG